jgi:hypothetical protein
MIMRVSREVERRPFVVLASRAMVDQLTLRSFDFVAT